MTAKRALIVDDSKSARAFLSRILEKYEIAVETAESAEQALEHLATHRPDVIFMDHLMPGMDGFQAVQLIKNNPRTATIPIMMYTSQEGELYLGQARALGAVGVLPKQIRPADVSKVLYQLKLVPDRRSSEQTTFQPVETGTLSAGGVSAAEARANADTPVSTASAAAATAVGAAGPAADAGLRELVDSAVHAQLVELRQFLSMSLDDHAARTASDVRTLLQDLPRVPATAAAPARASPWSWALASLALLAAIVFGTLWSREITARQAAEAKLAQQVAAAAAVAAAATAPIPEASEAAPSAAGETLAAPGEVAAPAASGGGARPSATASVEGRSSAARPAAAAVAAGASPAAPAVTTATVPYGEAPLSGARIELLRTTLSRAAAQGFHGVVEIRTFSGRFCLTGNATDGYSVAAEDTPYAKCDVVGNPHDEVLPPAQRESLDFANLVGSFRQSTGNAIEVRVAPGDTTTLTAAYPPTSEKMTAGEWNRAAAANNRVEVRLRPGR